MVIMKYGKRIKNKIHPQTHYPEIAEKKNT